MNGELFSVVDTLAGIAQKHGKPYCYPSQGSILGLLRSYHGLVRSRRTLNRYLRALEDQGYFVRVRRHIRGRDGNMVFRSTLYKLTGKVFNLMGRLRKRVGLFFGSFRVPSLAQYQPLQGQASVGKLPCKVVNGPSGAESGGPSATKDLYQAHLARIRDLIGKIGG